MFVLRELQATGGKEHKHTIAANGAGGAITRKHTAHSASQKVGPALAWGGSAGLRRGRRGHLSDKEWKWTKLGVEEGALGRGTVRTQAWSKRNRRRGEHWKKVSVSGPRP